MLTVLLNIQKRPLFTFASKHVVHLELIHDISVEGFLLALCQFASHKGLPAMLISDNAKTFKFSSKEVTKIRSQIC